MSLISAVTARGKMWFRPKESGGLNAAVFIEFFRSASLPAQSAQSFSSPVAARRIAAKKTAAFVETLGGKLRLFFLPPYSPDRNPGELV